LSPNSIRWTAFSLLKQVLDQGRFLSPSLDFCLKNSNFKAEDQGLLTQLLYGVLREKGYLDSCLQRWIQLDKTSSDLLHILRIGAYQILFLDKVPAYAAVDEAVESAKRRSSIQASKMVNACLRRLSEARESLLKERAKLLAEIGASDGDKISRVDEKWSSALSLPRWILERWKKEISPGEMRDLAQIWNSAAPIFLRANLRKTLPEDLKKKLGGLGGSVKIVSGTPMLLFEDISARELHSLMQEGWASMQDLGSYRVVEKVLEEKGGEILDVCAGHGGKSSAISEALGTSQRLFVHDPDAKRLQDLRGNFLRLDLEAPHFVSSSGEAQKQGLRFDTILIDAPCSGSGTMGRRPEIRWRLRLEDLQRHANLQKKILNEWLPLLKPGGRIIYSLCSLEEEEGPAVVNAFLSSQSQLYEVSRSKFWPQRHGHDGFFLSEIRIRA